MTDFPPPADIVEKVRQLVEPMPYPIPCDVSTACEIATELGYIADLDWLTSLMAVGCFPTIESFDYEELARLIAALDFRERWVVGKNDHLKSRTRIAFERNDVTLASGEMMAVSKFDSEALLAMLARDGGNMTDEVRQAVVDTIRMRTGLIQTPSQEPA